MSWIIGSLGKTKAARDYGRSCPTEPKISFNTDRIRIWAGGIDSTFRFGKLASGDEYYVLGYAVQVIGSSYYSITDWDGILSDESRISSLDGHFLIIINNGKELKVYNDPLGKRGLYIVENEEEIFFTSSLSALKEIKHPQIDYSEFGVHWHTRFPPSNDNYSPALNCPYRGVQTLGTGAKAILGDTVCITNTLLSPATESKDIYQLMESFSLLPVSQSQRMAIGLSGGMDVRPLLAVYLKAGTELTAVNYGNADSMDFRIAKQMAEDHNMPFRHVSYEEAEAEDSWEQACVFMQNRGLSANPANAPYSGYYKIVAEFADCFVSGFFGELFRFRFFVAHLASLLKARKPVLQDLAGYLYKIPPPIFQPEIQQQLHKGFISNLKASFETMPSAKGMLNPLWFNLFLARYLPATATGAILNDLDQVLLDHMPWLQAEIIKQHWQNGFTFQLGEGVHRVLLKRNFPALESYPLALADISAPYYYRQYMVKLKMWSYYKTHPLTRENRLDRFLQNNKEAVLDLFNSSKVQTNAAYNLKEIDSYLSHYYKGDGGYRQAVNTWLAYELGK
ncbi:MAG TPA: hypothetical protein P5533_05765 [Candidatus Cloacimonadota bacterium]|nr:hypothetical protein [Candidatus Cloacimonadota bacterium]